MQLTAMDEDLRQIHEATLKILEQTGMKFHHPQVIEVLKARGVKVEGQTAFFKPEQLMEWVSKAPGKINLYARNSQYNVLIGGDRVEVCPGSGSPAVSDLHGRKRPALMSDYIKFLKLYHQCNYFNLNGGILVQPTDIGQSTIPFMLYATLLYSDKAIVTGTGTSEEVEILMDMLAIAFGGKEQLKEKARAVTIVNTNTPLQFDKKMLETMLTFAKYNQPVVIAACSMASTTSPITLAGTIALTNAEVLAGIAVAQMFNEGTPVIYGSQTTSADLKTGSIAIGSPEGALCYQYAARLAHAYGLPCRGGGSLTDAKSLSVQAGYESMLTLLAAYSAKTNLIFQSCGIMESYNSMSYEKFIVDIEIIGMVKRFLEGVQVNEDTLAVDVINQVGIAGEFLTSMHTMKYLRKEPFIPDISLRGAVIGDDLDAKLYENIYRKEQKLLDNYTQPDLTEDIHAKLVDYLVAKGFNPGLVQALA